MSPDDKDRTAKVDSVTVKNTGSKVLHITSGDQSYELESGDEQKIVASLSNYTVTAGKTVVATIKYPYPSTFQVQKGDQLTGAKFSTTVEMAV